MTTYIIRSVVISKLADLDLSHKYSTIMAPSDRDVLPDTIKPVNYRIDLHDLQLGGSFSFQGSVVIQLDIKSKCKNIILNAHQLKIHNAEVSGQGVERMFEIASIGIIVDHCF